MTINVIYYVIEFIFTYSSIDQVLKIGKQIERLPLHMDSIATQLKNYKYVEFAFLGSYQTPNTVGDNLYNYTIIILHWGIFYGPVVGM